MNDDDLRKLLKDNQVELKRSTHEWSRILKAIDHPRRNIGPLVLGLSASFAFLALFVTVPLFTRNEDTSLGAQNDETIEFLISDNYFNPSESYAWID